MLHTALSNLKGYRPTALPYVLWEISGFSSKTRIFLEAENPTPSAQLPTQKTKQRRWGNFTQEPLQLQSNKKRKVRRSVGKPFLVWGVCNCRDFCLLEEAEALPTG